MNEIVLIEKQLPRLRQHEYRFLMFLRNASMPISEKEMVEFYIENIQMKISKETYGYNSKKEYVRLWIPYTDKDIYTLAMAWFDNNMGKAIRRGIVKRLHILED